MQDSLTWRDLLAKIIRDPQEKRYLARELHVNPLTLMRWASGESTPRAQNLRHLLQALPEYRKAFLELLPEEFGFSLTEPISSREMVQEIPSGFYARVLKAHAELSALLRFNSLCEMILQEALKHLDPNHVGMEITLAQCMPPSHDNKVRSLRESIGFGTGLWNRELEQHTRFLGSETLAGYVVASGRPLAIQNRHDGEHLFPARWIEHEQSAMAYPIMRSDRVAGCLLISCTQPDYFLSPVRKILIQHYAELLSIAFDGTSFYDLNAIAPGRLPSFEDQRVYISSFSQRVIIAMHTRQVNMREAERIAWQQIEEAMLCAHPLEESRHIIQISPNITGSQLSP